MVIDENLSEQVTSALGKSRNHTLCFKFFFFLSFLPKAIEITEKTFGGRRKGRTGEWRKVGGGGGG